jgi:hypothetical protein
MCRTTHVVLLNGDAAAHQGDARRGSGLPGNGEKGLDDFEVRRIEIDDASHFEWR